MKAHPHKFDKIFSVGKFASVVFIFFCLAFACGLNAQSVRRGSAVKKGALSSSPALESFINESASVNKYVYLGRVVEIFNGKAIVNMIGRLPKAPENWTVTFYTTGIKQEPAAIVAPVGVSHKVCMSFNVLEGTCLAGDLLFACLMPPEKEKNAN